MTPATIVYRYNRNPHRGLAACGIFSFKMLLAVPHFVLVGLLGPVVFAAAYIGYFAVAFAGSLPSGLQKLLSMWLRWTTRTSGWVTGITDEYPPFDADPVGYGIEMQTPTNNSPSRGWAVAGIFLIKVLAVVPHLFALMFVGVAATFVAWAAYFVVLFTGRFPIQMQDFIAGTTQWSARAAAWLLGLSDEYPPFTVAAHPAAG